MKSTKAAKNSLDINSKMSLVTNKLLKNGVCNSILQGEAVNKSFAATDTKTLNMGLRVGDKIPGTNLTTTEISFRRNTTSGDYFIQTKFQKAANEKSYGPNVLRREFPISVQMASGVVAKCHSDVDEAIDTATNESCSQVGGVMIGNICELTDATKEKIVWDTLNRPGKSTELFIKNDGSLTTQRILTYTYDPGKRYCKCHRPTCPSGEVTLSTWCDKSSSGTSKCGYSRWRYPKAKCKRTRPSLGRLYKR